jgi:hypothetical protein
VSGGDWLFPIGHYLGPFHRGRDAPVAHHQLRIGREPVHLQTEDELAAWLLAHGQPGAPADRPWTRQAVEAAALEQGGADRAAGVAGAIAELLEDGALAEVPDTAAVPDPVAVGFATGHRFCPLLVGLGADQRQPDQLIIGLTGNPVVAVDELGFQVWEWGPLYANLWEACRAFADVDSRLAGTASSQEGMLAEVLRRVHRLLAHGAGYLDLTS